MDLIFFVARIFRTRDRRNRRDRKEQPPGEILQMETPNLFEPIPEFSALRTTRTTRANSFGIVWEQLEQLEPLERLECLE